MTVLAARFRDRFLLPEGVVYLDGNSLGPLPKATTSRVAEVIKGEWGRDLVTSWNKHGWIDLPRRVGDKIARLIGAAPGEVMVADSTSINLFKLLGAALALRPERRVLLSERGNFPTDLYVAEGLAALLGQGHALKLVEADEIVAAIDDDVAVVFLTEVDYRTGRLHDMAAVTAAAHARGAVMLWDLAHSAGALPVDLHAAGANLAVGCGYKYLNGGPGAPAFLYVRQDLQEEIRMPLTGWLGHAAPFAFESGWRAAPGIGRALVGTPPILSLAALEVGVDLLLEADIEELRRASIALAERFIAGVEARCPALRLVSPREPARRGSQVSFAHPEGYAIVQALIARGVIGDFRAPDILRFGIAPLFIGEAEIDAAIGHLSAVLERREWDRPEYRKRAAVT
ncbi:MAG: kynureninase [Rhodospirillales bacterium]|nr:kynureninase [Rhodospirillales bacterium]